MKIFKTFVFNFIFLLYPLLSVQSQSNYTRTWGTYLGDETLNHHCSTIDNDGNIYIAGYVRYFSDIPLFQFTTQNAHQTQFGGGLLDGFIVKFNTQGQLVWGTYFGGGGDDRIDGISVDTNNNIYIIGTTTSSQNITTINSYQPTLNGSSDAFLAKLNPEGNLVWCTYYGGTNDEFGNLNYSGEDIINTGIAIDNQDNLYIFSTTESENLGTPNTFQPNMGGSNYILSKFSNSGNRIWSTYYGTNASRIDCIAINSTGIVVGGKTNDCPPYFTSNTYFATLGCHQPIPGSCNDSYISKFSLDGNRIWSTYYGGTGSEWLYTRNGTVQCRDGAIYYAATTSSNNNIATLGSFQETKDIYSHFLVKFNDFGERIWSTFYGLMPLSTVDNNNGVMSSYLTLDNNDNVFLSGSTICSNNIATSDSYQENIFYPSDSFIAKFSSDGQRIEGTYYGGNSGEYYGKLHLFGSSSYLIGSTRSTQNIGTTDSYQPNYISSGLNQSFRPVNIYIAKFNPTPLSTESFNSNSFKLYPNPNNGSFSIAFPQQLSEISITILDALGKCVYKENNVTSGHLIQTGNLAKGLYFVSINHENGSTIKKIIIE